MSYFSRQLDQVLSESRKLELYTFYHLNPTDESFEEWPILGRYEPNIVGRFEGKDQDGRYWFNVGQERVYVSEDEIGREAADHKLSYLERRILGDLSQRRTWSCFRTVHGALSFGKGYLRATDDAFSEAFEKLLLSGMIEKQDDISGDIKDGIFQITEIGRRALVDPQLYNERDTTDKFQLSRKQDIALYTMYKADNKDKPVLVDLDKTELARFVSFGSCRNSSSC